MTEKASAVRATRSTTVGQAWDVRPTALVAAVIGDPAASAMQDTLRRRGLQAWVGWSIDGGRIVAVSGTIVVVADGPGAAVTIALQHFYEVAEIHGLSNLELHDIVVQPAGRDERDWGSPVENP